LNKKQHGGMMQNIIPSAEDTPPQTL